MNRRMILVAFIYSTVPYASHMLLVSRNQRMGSQRYFEQFAKPLLIGARPPSASATV